MDRFLGVLFLVGALLTGVLILVSRWVTGESVESGVYTHTLLFLILGLMLFDRADRK